MNQRGFLSFDLLAYGLIAVTILSLVAAGVHVIKVSGENEERLRWTAKADKVRKAEQKKGQDAATGLEVDRGKTNVIYRTITQNVDRYIDRPVYRAECFDADGLRDANAALRGEIANPSQPDGGMPAPDGPGRRQGGNGPTQVGGGQPDVLRLRLETAPLGRSS